MEHFKSVLNQQSTFDEKLPSEILQCPVTSHLDEKPTTDEIQKAINQMSNGKAPGIEGIPAEVIKLCSYNPLPHLTELVELIWKEESVPQDFEDTVIVHIYKQGRPFLL